MNRNSLTELMKATSFLQFSGAAKVIGYLPVLMTIFPECGTCKENYKAYLEPTALLFALAGTNLTVWLLLEAMRLIFSSGTQIQSKESLYISSINRVKLLI